jgi:hypothetical protein
MKITILITLLFSGLTLSAQKPVYHWSFDDAGTKVAVEQVSGTEDPIRGYTDPVNGVKSGAVRFDGFTGYVYRDKSHIDLPRNFTVNAWIHLGSYPWFRCPVFDLRANEKEGITFGVNRWGQLCAGMGLPSTWVEFTGSRLPLDRWVMVSLVVKEKSGSVLYIDGNPVGEIAFTPVLRATRDNHFSCGRNAVMEDWWDFQYTVKDHYSYLDGRVDELTVYDKDLSMKELSDLWQSFQPVPDEPGAPRVLPSGPAGKADFGAVYTRLHYTDQWDRLWRNGDRADVLVRFADNDCRLVFWRGTGYVPCWVTENGTWYTNEWTETWGSDVSSCAEPLMDRDCRFSNVRIIENTPARTIIEWRYALVDADYKFVAQDIDGKGEWTEEYYIIYPDGIGIRKIDLFYSKPLRNHDWEESIILLSPGQHPDEVIADPEVRLINMKGEYHDYSWRRSLPVEMKEPQAANIHVVNLKSRYKPFYIVNPEPFETKEGKYDAPFFRSYAAFMADNWRPDSVPSIYGWWNHWPVTPVPGDGRWVETNDRASHFNLTTYTQWKDYSMDDRVKSRIMLHGMTDGKPGDLVGLAKSWLSAPALELKSGQARYDQAQRAYVIDGQGRSSFEGRFLADAEHPAWHPALVIENTRLEHPTVELNGKKLTEGKDFESGNVLTDKGYRTIIYLSRVIREEALITIR